MRLSLFTNVSYVVHQQIPLKLTKKGHAKHLPIARHGKILDPSYLETNHTSYLCYTSDFFWIFFTISSFYYFMVVMWVGGGGVAEVLDCTPSKILHNLQSEGTHLRDLRPIIWEILLGMTCSCGMGGWVMSSLFQ